LDAEELPNILYGVHHLPSTLVVASPNVAGTRSLGLTYTKDAGDPCLASTDRTLNQDFQEQKCSSAALVPLEIPRKPWPCTFFALGGEQRRASKSWLIRVRLLVPAPPAWAEVVRGAGQGAEEQENCITGFR